MSFLFGIIAAGVCGAISVWLWGKAIAQFKELGDGVLQQEAFMDKVEGVALIGFPLVTIWIILQVF